MRMEWVRKVCWAVVFVVEFIARHAGDPKVAGCEYCL